MNAKTLRACAFALAFVELDKQAGTLIAGELSRWRANRYTGTFHYFDLRGCTCACGACGWQFSRPADHELRGTDFLLVACRRCLRKRLRELDK